MSTNDYPEQQWALLGAHGDALVELEAQRELVRVGIEEIERLRADNQRLTDENEELRADQARRDEWEHTIAEQCSQMAARLDELGASRSEFEPCPFCDPDCPCEDSASCHYVAAGYEPSASSNDQEAS